MVASKQGGEPRTSQSPAPRLLSFGRRSRRVFRSCGRPDTAAGGAGRRCSWKGLSGGKRWNTKPWLRDGPHPGGWSHSGPAFPGDQAAKAKIDSGRGIAATTSEGIRNYQGQPLLRRRATMKTLFPLLAIVLALTFLVRSIRERGNRSVQIHCASDIMRE